MKISKLFHWLYAFLMFLPVLALAPSLFYFAFNQQSQNYTEVQVNETYEYETNEVNSVDDLVVGNIYKFNLLQNISTNTTVIFIQGSYLKYEYDFNYSNYTKTSHYVDIIKSNNNDVNIANGSYYGSNVIRYGCGGLKNGYLETNYNNGQPNYLNATFYIVYQNIPDLNLYNVNFNLSASDYLGEKNVEVVRSEQSPMNIFYTAVNYVYDMPVFSWAKNSFLALPITYVTGLFGMASTNVVNYYLSYWLAISIVYLVFDLVMYVPLLVHRWIDKGMIE